MSEGRVVGCLSLKQNEIGEKRVRTRKVAVDSGGRKHVESVGKG